MKRRIPLSASPIVPDILRNAANVPDASQKAAADKFLRKVTQAAARRLEPGETHTIRFENGTIQTEVTPKGKNSVAKAKFPHYRVTCRMSIKRGGLFGKTVIYDMEP